MAKRSSKTKSRCSRAAHAISEAALLSEDGLAALSVKIGDGIFATTSCILGRPDGSVQFNWERGDKWRRLIDLSGARLRQLSSGDWAPNKSTGPLQLLARMGM